MIAMVFGMVKITHFEGLQANSRKADLRPTESERKRDKGAPRRRSSVLPDLAVGEAGAYSTNTSAR